MPLQSSIVRQPLLDDDDRLQMLRLHSRYFDNVLREVFLRDMAEKDWVIVLRDGTRTIAGFSTLRVLTLTVDAADCVFLFSGDTIVDQKYRQRGLLAGTFGHMMLRVLEDNPGIPAYWFLISKGYRTYRFLPVYFHHFFPRYDRATPEPYTRRIAAIATHLFGPSYDARTGIVRHSGIRDRLAPALSSIPSGRIRDPHVDFFVSRNALHAEGDELACIADIALDNFNAACRRLMARTAVEWRDKELSCAR
jgi:hypothetical protein